MLAVYDGAEVILKPVFGAFADRIGPRPVLLGGLIAFSLFSGAFVLTDDPALLCAARLGQGASAAAFSPAASALLARLAGPRRAFGGYSSFKSLGYTTGPLLSGALITFAGGYSTLFTTLAAVALAVAVWAIMQVPSAAPLARHRTTVLDLARHVSARHFLIPTLCLAAATAALAAGVGFSRCAALLSGSTPR